MTENEKEIKVAIEHLKARNMSAKHIDMAIQALEKQIPKKPIDKLMYLECPTCGDVEIEDCGYCPCCGQKLDWQLKGGAEWVR